MNASIAWAAVALIMGFVAVNVAYTLGMLKGARKGAELGKAIGRAERIIRARDFASSIGRN